MAIDSTLWFADVPAGAYSVGDIVPLSVKAGPMNVRSGRGQAILKNIVVGTTTGSAPFWKVHIKNSNWVDDVQSFAGQLNQPTSFASDSGLVQSGSNDVLFPNSGWDVWAECIIGGTSTADASIFALVDLDYPSVSAVADPSLISGIPTSIEQTVSVPVYANGNAKNATWSVVSVDYFKAGFVYCLSAIEMIGNAQLMFVGLSNAAGMGGLTRIVPLNNSIYGIRHRIAYSSRLVKGPMDVKFMAFGTTSADSISMSFVHDYIKKVAT